MKLKSHQFSGLSTDSTLLYIIEADGVRKRDSPDHITRNGSNDKGVLLLFVTETKIATL